MTITGRRGLAIFGAFGAAGACAAAVALPAEAHGFGERYDLPLPLSLFVIAGAAAVALSFVIAAVFLRGENSERGYLRLNLLGFVATRWMASPWITGPLKAISVALTVYVIVGALVGTERAPLNPAPAAIYVAFWVGLSFFTALFGNLWALVNPWKIAWEYAERLTNTLAPGQRPSLQKRYPARWGPWPAVLVFVAFAILETVAADAAGPRRWAGSWCYIRCTTSSGCTGTEGTSGCATPKDSPWCTGSWLGFQ